MKRIEYVTCVLFKLKSSNKRRNLNKLVNVVRTADTIKKMSGMEDSGAKVRMDTGDDSRTDFEIEHATNISQVAAAAAAERTDADRVDEASQGINRNMNDSFG